MKRIVICFLFLGLTLCHLSGQSEEYVAEGDKAYSVGQYNSASKKYKAALAIMNKENLSKASEKYLIVEKKNYKSEEGGKLYNKAEARFKTKTEKGYKDARTFFQQLLSQNKTDIIARQKIKICSEQLGILVGQKEQALEELKIERALWDSISVLQDLDAYAYYLSNYPQGAFGSSAREAINTIGEEVLWKQVSEEDTLEAYLKYLSSSKILKYIAEANLNICQKKDDSYWKSITSSKDTKAIKEYVSNFSATGCKQYVNEGLLLFRQHELAPYYELGKKHYDQKRYKMVIAQYDQIKKKVPLTEEAQVIYADSQAEISYSSVKKSKKINDWDAFIQKHPNSRHYAEMANKLAKAYADKLNKKSSQADCDRALHLASDDKTKKYVMQKMKKIGK